MTVCGASSGRAGAALGPSCIAGGSRRSYEGTSVTQQGHRSGTQAHSWCLLCYDASKTDGDLKVWVQICGGFDRSAIFLTRRWVGMQA